MQARTLPFESPAGGVSLARTAGPLAGCAAVGFLSAFTFSFGGKMPVGELLLLALFPWVLVKAAMLKEWPARMQQLGWFHLLLVLSAVTAAGYVASDLYRATSAHNLVRGWARVGFLVLDLVTIAFLVDRSWARLRTLVVALYAGNVVHAVVAGPLHGEWWKFGVGYPLTVLGVLLVAGRPVMLQSLVALGLAALNFVMGARSLGAVCLLTSVFLVQREVRGLWRLLILVGALGVAAGLSVLADRLVLQEQDHEGSNLERRSMVDTSLQLFLESPVLGQGSWFTAGKALSRLEENRAAIDPGFRTYTAEEAGQLSIHSQLLTALAEAGILGGAFFLGLGALLLKTTRTLLWHAIPARAFMFYLVLSGLWNLLMSPFSGVARVEIAVLVCACLLVILQRQEELPDEFRE